MVLAIFCFKSFFHLQGVVMVAVVKSKCGLLCFLLFDVNTSKTHSRQHLLYYFSHTHRCTYTGMHSNRQAEKHIHTFSLSYIPTTLTHSFPHSPTLRFSLFPTSIPHSPPPTPPNPHPPLTLSLTLPFSPPPILQAG